MPKILIADDEPGVLATLKQYFELAQYTIYIATDGNDVLGLVPVKLDIFLLDINMPNMDGLTVCRRIAREGYKMAQIVNSVTPWPEDIMINYQWLDE